ncbi:uncharacterized protein LOC117177255 isoform X2 [Belonocnema kinseyi]|uniref:uncharacterized protein LOC117177255 isoform X2 n=1 Tax=Belonocnema kinseyi TaxID=2817044 RepID=UPI00143D4D89|nr:uncharacterized protein LOC117177255 isoform X2 [Belonocnema kinseyi]
MCKAELTFLVLTLFSATFVDAVPIIIHPICAYDHGQYVTYSASSFTCYKRRCNLAGPSLKYKHAGECNSQSGQTQDNHSARLAPNDNVGVAAMAA